MTTLTALTAIYGAVLATIVFAWNVYQFFLDKGKFRVSCMIGRMLPGGIGFTPVDDSQEINASDQLYWYVTNVGRRPLTLRSVGGLCDARTGESFTIPLEDGPKMILPGGFATQGTAISPDMRALHSLVAVDATGKYFYAKRKEVRSVRERARAICR